MIVSPKALLESIQAAILDNGKFESLLAKHDISLIKDYQQNCDAAKEFYDHYYQRVIPRVVICGINPGRFGAGKTGIPFIDFASMGKLLPKYATKSVDSESSAKYFYSIVEHFGADEFFGSFYVTNVSSVGFLKDNKNQNYDSLPQEAQAHIFRCFVQEMEFVNPTHVIALSKEVQHTIKHLLRADIDTSKSLPHPNYSAFPGNIKKCTAEYVAVLSAFIPRASN